MGRVHVVGAGLAGLSTAIHLDRQGVPVSLYEAAPQAGGRCRSYFDEQLGCEIDNGGHILLGANADALAFLDIVGGRAAMQEVAPAQFPFLDLASGETWSIRPNRGPIPWWPFAPSRRAPKTHGRDYLAALCLLTAAPHQTVADRLNMETVLATSLWAPLTTAVMNAAPDEAAARLLAATLRETFGRGEKACRPIIARHGLSQAFAHPAVNYLKTRTAAEYRPGYRLVAIELETDTVAALVFDEERIPIRTEDRIVLAVPPHVAAGLLPSLTVPLESRAIVNAHFRLDDPVSLPGGQPLLGLTNGTAQWLISRDNVVSVTVSAADALVDMPSDALLATLWADVAKALSLPAMPMPRGRLIKERRATFAQTPENQKRRPGPTTVYRNLFLAGDWTATGLPASIESAIRSGRIAAQQARTSKRPS